MYYNEELKNEYIERAVANTYLEQRIRKIFADIKETEEFFGKDLCEMTAEEFDVAKKAFNAKSLWAMDNKMRDVRKYLIWCIDNEKTKRKLLPFKTNTREYDLVGNYLKSMFGSPADFKNWLDVIFHHPNDEMWDIYYLVNSWMIYAGVHQNLTYHIPKEDVDLIKMKITTAGKILDLPPESKEAFMVYSQLKSTMQITKKNGVRYDIKPESDYFLVSPKKSKDNSFSKKPAGRIPTIIIDANKSYQKITGTDFATSATNIFLSGWFYRIFLKEKETGEIDHYGTMGIIPEINKLPQNPINVRADYENWKEAFYPEE